MGIRFVNEDIVYQGDKERISILSAVWVDEETNKVIKADHRVLKNYLSFSWGDAVEFGVFPTYSKAMDYILDVYSKKDKKVSNTY
jgi:hypothetical protein